MNNLNNTYILNPDYYFKNDINRILLLSKAKTDNSFSASNWVSFIHPLQAIILSTFTVERTLEEHINHLSDLLQKDNETIKSLVTPYIENDICIFTTWAGVEIDFPTNVVVNRNKIEHYTSYEIDIDYFKCEGEDFLSKRINSSPLDIILMLTNRCVTNCKYCYADTKTKVTNELSTPRILEIIDNAAALKMRSFDLIGGEVFLKKEWEVILKHMVDSDLSPAYLSTKIPITQDIIHKLQSTGFKNEIQVSLDTLNSEVMHTLLKVGSNYVDKMKEGILLLDSFGFPIRIATMLTDFNTDEQQISELYTFINSIKNLTDWEIRVPMNSLYKDEKEILDYKANKKKISSIIKFIEKEIIPGSNDRTYITKLYLDNADFYQNADLFNEHYCSALYSSMFILPDGKVTICEQLYWTPQFIIGDLTDNTIEEVWNSEKSNALLNIKQHTINKESACYVCKDFDNCFRKQKRCWVNIIKAYGTSNWSHPDPKCKKAPQIKINLAY